MFISREMCLTRCMAYYHTSISHECMGVYGEALQLHSVYKKPYFLLQVTWEFVSVLQVTRESVSSTASHACCIAASPLISSCTKLFRKNITINYALEFGYITLHRKDLCMLCMLARRFCVSRKSGTGGGGWGHPQGAVHVLAARLGCERAMAGTG